VKEKTDTSIIIPTFQESENLPELIRQIAGLRTQLTPIELIIVDDDSNDGTEEYITSLNYNWIKLIVRKNQRGLSSAVIEGFKQAQYSVLVCMDADLSHPVETIPQMVEIIQQGDVDFVLGSRFIKGGSVDKAWSTARKFNAWMARTIAKYIINKTDPLSGFFCIKKTTFLSVDFLDPIGYKIGLELMTKCNCKNIVEIPIHFSERYKGKSKLTLKERFKYLVHISRLLKYKYSR